MLAQDAARELAAHIPARVGAIAVSVWYDTGAVYLRVYLDPTVRYLRQQLPKEYQGFRVSIEDMPEFRQLPAT